MKHMNFIVSFLGLLLVFQWLIPNFCYLFVIYVAVYICCCASPLAFLMNISPLVRVLQFIDSFSSSLYEEYVHFRSISDMIKNLENH